jgi:hypothetical protein
MDEHHEQPEDPHFVEPDGEQKEVPPDPREAHLRKLGRGPYYIAPDSAEAIPDAIWRRLDPDDVMAAAQRSNETLNAELGGGEQRTANGPSPHANFLPAASQALLRSLGGPVAARVLEGVDDHGTSAAA